MSRSLGMDAVQVLEGSEFTACIGDWDVMVMIEWLQRECATRAHTDGGWGGGGGGVWGGGRWD